MADWLIGWSLRHRYAVLLAAVAVAVAGVVSVRRMNFDAFPDTTPVQVQINTTAPALVPEEIERLITLPIELAVGGLPGLVQLRSTSQFGLSAVVATFADGTDIYFARQVINERLSSVEMPIGIERPRLGPVATGLGEVFQYKLTSSEMSLTDLRTLHDWVIKPKLRSVPGVAEINSWGGLEKQYQVRIDPLRLVAHDISFHEVVEAVRNNNLNVGGGNIHENQTGEMLLVEGIGRTTTIEQIKNIVVRAEQGVPVCVRDVADVVIGHQIRVGTVTADGQGEVVLGLGFMLMGQNSYGVTHALKQRLAEVKQSLPPGVDVTTVYDRSQLVEQVIGTVRGQLVGRGALGRGGGLFLLGQLASRLDRGPGHSAFDAIRIFGHGPGGHCRHPAQSGSHRFRHCRRQLPGGDREYYRATPGQSGRQPTGNRTTGDERSSPAGHVRPIDHRGRLSADPDAPRNRRQNVPAHGLDRHSGAGWFARDVAHVDPGAGQLSAPSQRRWGPITRAPPADHLPSEHTLQF